MLSRPLTYWGLSRFRAFHPHWPIPRSPRESCIIFPPRGKCILVFATLIREHRIVNFLGYSGAPSVLSMLLQFHVVHIPPSTRTAVSSPDVASGVAQPPKKLVFPLDRPKAPRSAVGPRGGLRPRGMYTRGRRIDRVGVESSITK